MNEQETIALIQREIQGVKNGTSEIVARYRIWKALAKHLESEKPELAKAILSIPVMMC